MSVALDLSPRPRVSGETRVAIAIASVVATINLLAALAFAPSPHLQAVGERVDASRFSPAIAGGPWDLLVGALLFPLAWGLLRRRVLAWASALGMLGTLGAVELWRGEPPLEVAVPALGIALLVALRRRLVAEPYRALLQRHMLPSAEAAEHTRRLLREHGRDALAPFKLRPDVGRLFSDRGDAVLAFRVENRALLVAGDPIGSPRGVLEVIGSARDLARDAGLRFGISSASEELAEAVRVELGLHPIYLGCEAVVDTATFTLEGKAIKKVRQAHRRVVREGYDLALRPLSNLDRAERAAMRRCRERARPDERSFAMAPESLECESTVGALVAFARHRESGEVAGLMVLVPLSQRSLWSLALQLRDPSAPNGVIDALIVHALQEAKAAGVAEVSLNFAAGRRYMHEPMRGFWPRVGKACALLAKRWTQIDDLRYHNEKFAPRWEPRYGIVDHKLHAPHVAFAIIWQEGQLPRPDALLSPAWPQTAADLAAT